jgi:hypothetical protein
MDRFFGYGSLVNTATHPYGGVRRERIEGWRRVWRHTAHHAFAYLTAEQARDAAIDGLSADVPDGDWLALDTREAGYVREPLPVGPSIYHIPDGMHPAPKAPKPILLSYLDVVVQGYAQQFGTEGVKRFFETTTGWNAPIFDDRDEPQYPRAQPLSSTERALVDDWLKRVR